ncbi:hypothetical protein AF335_23980 [Streptomyces eurocidicus]|uniref:DUF397 domain-containing protein n=1 Tax=Streptomyces eurocidicus TaxID=66423 RepID=A0A2N8NQU7_STREU|nr:DUF397 domain-containing protein [Streptomyces eurocidicus]MBB5116892.1 hypothetical protein [Streptomyces eurocidicus]MBF6052802.1 DUF397 domain-containing protein [Streptomyces eurocidicus]PNE31135.1 hypothetical protein AF335_23980 [Streptomyces eurocidicus]
MRTNFWQKSSFCAGGGNNCLELSARQGVVEIRESEHAALTVSTGRIGAALLVREIKAGRLDRIT